MNHKKRLAEWLRANRCAAPRYGPVRVYAASERALGYFAEAFSAEVMVCGVTYTSDKLATTRDRAAHRAAAAALLALEDGGAEPGVEPGGEVAGVRPGAAGVHQLSSEPLSER